MDREYIAFISYRHLPLEMATAKKLHKRIERFVIPKDLRRDGRKHPGLVFRDQDELHSSSNLSDSIRQALDHSQYLIVICTPETTKSVWVLREISYFLEHHDRDHVLAVLADGTPEAAFPELLTELRSPDGEVLERIEPLAANLVTDSDRKRGRLFRTESLRILAALIGCPYDALYRRERRYRRRRAAIAAAVAVIVAAAFVGLLFNRNAQIEKEQLQSLVSESKTLAALSEQAYREGDYNGALRYALSALPAEGSDRPYVAEAEFALSRELDLYRQGVMRYARSMDLEAGIAHSAVSADGSFLAAADTNGVLRCCDLNSGALLWEYRGSATDRLEFLEKPESLLVSGEGGILSLDPTTGRINWSRGDLAADDLAAVSPDGSVALLTPFLSGGCSPTLLDLRSGEVLTVSSATIGSTRNCAAAALSDDLSGAALLLQRSVGSMADLYLWPADGGEPVWIDGALPFSAGSTAYKLLFRENGDLLLACDDHEGQSYFRLYDASSDWAPRLETPLETERMILESGSAANPFAAIDFFDTVGERVVVGSKHQLYMLDLSDGSILWHRTLNAFLLAARLYKNECMGLILSDGTVSFCTDEGYLSDSMGIYNFRCGYELAGAAIVGDSYPDGSFVVVPEDFPQRAALIRFVDNPDMFPVAAIQSSYAHVSMIASPSGELVLCLAYDPVGQPVEAILLDGREGSTSDSILLSSGGGWEDPGLLCLTEDGVLISPKGFLDAVNVSFSAPEGSGGSLVSANCAASGEVLSCRLADGKPQTLEFYTDGKLTAGFPCPDGSWEIAEVGGCGYSMLRDENGKIAICSKEGVWCEVAAESGSVCALGSERPLLAVLSGEKLSILDLSGGKETPCSDLPSTTIRLLFAYDDAALFAFTDTGELFVIVSEDGTHACNAQFDSLGLHFSRTGARYAIASAFSENRTLIFFDDLKREQPLCLVYDEDVSGFTGFYEAVGAYLPGRNSVLVAPMMDGIYLNHFYSREEIAAIAAEKLGEG